MTITQGKELKASDRPVKLNIDGEWYPYFGKVREVTEFNLTMEYHDHFKTVSLAYIDDFII